MAAHGSCLECNVESWKYHPCPQSSYRLREEVKLAVFANWDKCCEGKLEVATDHDGGEYSKPWKDLWGFSKGWHLNSGQDGVFVSCGCHNKTPQTWCLKMTEVMETPQLWKLELQNEGVSRAPIPPRLFLASGGGRQSLAYLDFQLHHSRICLYYHMGFSLCVSQDLLLWTPSYWTKGPPYRSKTHLN